MRSTLAALLPGPGLMAGPSVLCHDDFPDPLVRQFDFPPRHGRFPRMGFDRQPDPSLLDSPEQIGFLELGDRPGIHEVRWRRIEAVGGRPVTVEQGPMARGAISRIEPL